MLKSSQFLTLRKGKDVRAPRSRSSKSSPMNFLMMLIIMRALEALLVGGGCGLVAALVALVINLPLNRLHAFLWVLGIGFVWNMLAGIPIIREVNQQYLRQEERNRAKIDRREQARKVTCTVQDLATTLLNLVAPVLDEIFGSSAVSFAIKRLADWLGDDRIISRLYEELEVVQSPDIGLRDLLVTRSVVERESARYLVLRFYQTFQGYEEKNLISECWVEVHDQSLPAIQEAAVTLRQSRFLMR